MIVVVATALKRGPADAKNSAHIGTIFDGVANVVDKVRKSRDGPLGMPSNEFAEEVADSGGAGVPEISIAIAHAAMGTRTGEEGVYRDAVMDTSIGAEGVYG